MFAEELDEEAGSPLVSSQLKYISLTYTHIYTNTSTKERLIASQSILNHHALVARGAPNSSKCETKKEDNHLTTRLAAYSAADFDMVFFLRAPLSSAQRVKSRKEYLDLITTS